MRLSIFVVFVLALTSPALAQLKKGSVNVGKDGSVTLKGKPLGKVPLPPGSPKLLVSRSTVQGHQLVLVQVTGKGGRAGVLLSETAPTARTIYQGSTGAQGVDGEWSQHLQVSGKGVLRYQSRLGATRCDGKLVYLFPQMYDFTGGAFRPVSMRPGVKGLTRITATRTPPGKPDGPPLNTFNMIFASTQRGDGQRAAELVAPRELEDGDPKTVWSEALGGHGRGEVLTARGQASRYRLRAIRIVPGDVSSKKAFAAANRLKSVVVALSAKERYLVEFPKDPLRDRGKIQDPYWIVLPKPVATRCVSLIINEVYPGRLAGGKRGGGRTAISEARLYTDLEFGGGMKQLVKDLGSSDEQRASAAVTVLARLGVDGLKAVEPVMAGATGPALQRMVRVLMRSQRPEAAAPLAAALPKLGPVQQRLAFDALSRHGPAAVAPLVKLLDRKGALLIGVTRALGSIGMVPARDALMARAGKGELARRKAMVQGLALLRWSSDVPVLVAAAVQSKAPLRQADLILAAGRLARRFPHASEKSRKAAAHLAVLWKTASDFEIRYRLLGAIGALAAADHLPLLIAASRPTTMKDDVLRWTALQQLRRVKVPEATDALILAGGDSCPRVRATAAGALGERSSRAAVVRVLNRLARKDPWSVVAGAAATSLGSHCGEETVDTLREVTRLGPRGLDVDLHALNSLSRCKPNGLATFLLAMAGEKRWRADMREQAMSLITPAMARAHIAALIELFKKVRKRTMVSLAAQKVTVAGTEVLARLGGGNRAAVKALDDALALNMNPVVRVAAALALSKVCHRSTLASLRQARKDPEPRVRHAAAKSIKQCGWR